MAVIINLDEIPRRQIREIAEGVIRDWVGRRSDAENWNVWIYASFGVPTYCEVIVQGPSERREKCFFQDIEGLPAAIRDWLRLYPPR